MSLSLLGHMVHLGFGCERAKRCFLYSYPCIGAHWNFRVCVIWALYMPMIFQKRLESFLFGHLIAIFKCAKYFFWLYKILIYGDLYL